MTTPLFPASAKSWTDLVDFEDDYTALDLNEARAEITAIETELLNKYKTTTNVGNIYSATFGLTSLTDGRILRIKCNADSTGNVYLNPDSLGNITVLKGNGSNVTNWKTNSIYTVAYNSTTGNFILQGDGDDSSIVAADLLLNEKNTSTVLVNGSTTLTYSSGVLTQVDETNTVTSKLMKRTTLTYTSNVLTSVTTYLYADDGTTVTKTITETLTYASGSLTSVAKAVV